MTSLKTQLDCDLEYKTATPGMSCSATNALLNDMHKASYNLGIFKVQNIPRYHRILHMSRHLTVVILTIDDPYHDV
jgi:hypothetical protein